MAITSARYQKQHVSSETVVRWEIEPEKLQCSSWRDLRYDQRSE